MYLKHFLLAQPQPRPWLYDCAVLVAVLPPSMPPTGPVSNDLGWGEECFVWLGLVLGALECLETNLFPLTVARFGDTAMFFKQAVARASPLHLSLTAVISAVNKRRLFPGMFSPQPHCSALAMFPLEPFLIGWTLDQLFPALSRTEIKLATVHSPGSCCRFPLKLLTT